MSGISEGLAKDLKGFGGHLECSVCRRTQELGEIGSHLASGWPKCCGYTMSWLTENQLSKKGNVA